MAGAQVAAVIDWADCAVASPWLDLARVTPTAPRLRDALLGAYFPGGVPSDAVARLADHDVLCRLFALVWEREAGGEWLHERVPGIERTVGVVG